MVVDEKEELTAQQRKEMELIQRAMAEENERAVTTKSRQSLSREEEDVPRWSKGAVSSHLYMLTCDRQKFVSVFCAGS